MESRGPDRSTHPRAHTVGTWSSREPNPGPREAAFGLSLPLTAATACLPDASRCGILSSWSLTIGQMLGTYLALIQNAQSAEGTEGPREASASQRHWPETGTLTPRRGYFSLPPAPFSTVCSQHTNPGIDIFLLSL